MTKKIIIILSSLNKGQINKNKTKKLFWNKDTFSINFKTLKNIKKKDLLNYFMIKFVNILAVLLNQKEINWK